MNILSEWTLFVSRELSVFEGESHLSPLLKHSSHNIPELNLPHCLTRIIVLQFPQLEQKM